MSTFPIPSMVNEMLDGRVKDGPLHGPVFVHESRGHVTRLALRRSKPRAKAESDGRLPHWRWGVVVAGPIQD